MKRKTGHRDGDGAGAVSGKGHLDQVHAIPGGHLPGGHVRPPSRGRWQLPRQPGTTTGRFLCLGLGGQAVPQPCLSSGSAAQREARGSSRRA